MGLNKIKLYSAVFILSIQSNDPIKDFKGQNGSIGMDVDNSEAFFERDDDDDLEILATPPKLFEEVTLDEDDDDDVAADNVVAEKISEPSKFTAPSPDESSTIQTENIEIPNLSPRNSGEIGTESRLPGTNNKSVAENISKEGEGGERNPRGFGSPTKR